jgi:biopolymer transport protein ExbB
LSSSLFSLVLLQIPGEGPDMTFADVWEGGGFMMWFLGATFLIGMIVIVIKLIDLTTKGARTRRVLREVDALVAEGRIPEAIEAAERSNTPAGRILSEGLRRHAEGTERVVKAIENAGMIEMAKLERGLATVSTVAPLLGFLGTVIGMIQAFQAIEVAGEVEATLVAGGIKVALITTASGLAIAIPVSIAHNYFVSRIDRLVIDMEESAQRTIDALHEMEVRRAPATAR